MKTRDIFIALLVPIVLGFGFVIAKPAMQYFPPYLLMGMRFTIPALILVWWFPLPKGIYFDLFKVSFIGSTLQYGLTYTGLNIIDASSAILLVQLEVPFGIVIAFFLLKEVPTLKNIVGLLVAFIGVFILTGAPNLEGKYLGVLLVLSGAFTWALGAVLAKPLSKKIGAFALMTWLCVFSGPMLLIVSLVFDGNPIPYFLSANINSWLTVAFLGFFMQPVGYAAWYYVLKKYPVNKVMPVLLILPVTGLLTSIFLLGEDPPKQVFLGGLVIISGVALILFTKKKNMNKSLPKNAKAVIIGGGVAGCSVAYHLGKYGWKDVVLLERDQLTSGTTWHAAGLVSQLGPSAAITKIRKYSLELYKKLEKEVDFSSGLKLNGALSIATTKGRWQELLRQATTAQLYDVNVEVLNIEQIKKIYPIINEEGIYGGIFMPGDGQADPVGVTNLLAKAARNEGVQIFQNSPVQKILIKKGRIHGVKVNDQTIECEYVVLATGIWSRQIGADIGVSIPLYPAEHFYVITEPMNNLPKNIPVLRDFDDSLYLKEDAGKMLIGIFEGKSIPAFNKENRVPEDFSFGEFPENFEHFEPYLEASLNRVPILKKAGIRKFFAGPESFTPDTNTLLGEVPEVRNFFACCGFNSIGIGSGGGAGKVTAEWMIKGHINEDLFIYDIKRFQKFHSKINFIKERVTETLGDLYGMHWPHKQHKTSRNQKLFPYHEELKKAGACFGVSAGYERPMWFALSNNKAEFEYSYNYQNWYPSVEFETKNARKNIGLFDLTAFSKYNLKGEKTHNELQRICTANIKNIVGKTTYTQMLNEDGGIEADLTVVCVEKNFFRIITSAANREHDKFHILKHLSQEVEFEDVTDQIACFGIFGPKSRNLMSKLSSDDFSNEKFKFGTSKSIKINNKEVWVQRLSYVGELGFELYVKIDESKEIYNLIINKGKEYDLAHCGMLSMDTMRMEKGYLHWGHDMSPEENQYEAGLSFAISFKKNINFIGKEAITRIKNKKIKKKMVMLTLKDSRPGSPLLLHDEPIYCEKKIVGRTTSCNYSFNYKKNISFGYINLDATIEELTKKTFFIEVEKKKYEAVLQKKTLHDPENKMLKS